MRRSEGAQGRLDALLLGALAGTPGHGYAVIQALRERSAGVFDLQEGVVYPALHRLEDGGLLASEWVLVAGRRRRVYRITAAGEAALSDERREWSRYADAVSRVLAAAPRVRVA